LLFLLSYLAGEGLHRLAPLPLNWLLGARGADLLAVLFLSVGVTLVLICVMFFLGARTTPIPYRRPAVLVMWGPYRFSRNPMYVGVTSIYLGVAALRGVLWPVLLLPIPLLVLNRWVIPEEEALLRATFGAAYERYCARVRRWL
jgi:protein-S-isoprenylcysteine O-methyltransferase Ste14